MSGKCSKCEVELTKTEVIANCVECKSNFHPACTRARSVQNFTKLKNKSWKCDTCRDESSSQRSSEDLVEDKKSILEAIAEMNKEINMNISEVRGSIVSLADEMKQLSSKFETLEARQEELKKRCDVLEREKVELSDELRDLRLQMQDAEQHSRSANIEIVGLPWTKDEDVYLCLEKIAGAIGVLYKREDFSTAHRLRLFSKKHSHPPIIAQFISRSVKATWLLAVRSKKSLDVTEMAASLPSGPVYLNEHLTTSNKTLLGRARRLVREKKLHFAGFFNGKILIKKNEGDAALRVRTLEDLDQYDL